MPRIPSPGKKDRAKTREAVELSHDLIAEAYPELTQALIDKAVGLRFQDEKGNVYTKEPDTVALIRALEILGGKPTAALDIKDERQSQEFEEWIKGQIAAPTVEVLPVDQGGFKPALPHPVVPGVETLVEDALSDVVRDLGWD